MVAASDSVVVGLQHLDGVVLGAHLHNVVEAFAANQVPTDVKDLQTRVVSHC